MAEISDQELAQLQQELTELRAKAAQPAPAPAAEPDDTPKVTHYALLGDGSTEEVYNAGLPTHVAKVQDGRQVVVPVIAVWAA